MGTCYVPDDGKHGAQRPWVWVETGVSSGLVLVDVVAVAVGVVDVVDVVLARSAGMPVSCGCVGHELRGRTHRSR